MRRKPVIIDCDTGTDDAIALIAALGNECLDIKAVTAVCGNVNLCYTSANTLNLLRMLGFATPVAKGAEEPLIRDLSQIRASEGADLDKLPTHGETGMGNVTLKRSNKAFHPQNAVETIYAQALACNGELEIIGIGPQTNIALAIKTYPELKNGLIKHITFMGGAVNGGNFTAVAEYNIFFDPEAAKIVLNSGINMTMIGLDVTLKALVPDDVCRIIREIGSPAALVTADILDFMRMRRDRFGGEDTVMHDALAVAAICKPEILKMYPYYVDVECAGTYTYGHTYVQHKQRLSNRPTNCNVAMDINKELFVNWLIESIRDCHPI